MLEANWFPSEAWTWEQIRSGRIADFNARFGKTLDPRDPQGWGEERRLGSGFLRTLFSDPPYRDTIPPEGVRIIGAFLPAGQVLRYASIDRQIWLNRCRSEGPIDFAETTFSRRLSVENSLAKQSAGSSAVNVSAAQIHSLHLDGVIAEGPLISANLQVCKVLFMRGATFRGEVILANAKIDGQLAMDGSSFEEKLDGDSLQVGQTLFMHETRFKGEVVLCNANIGGQLGMDDSTFEQKLNAPGIQVRQDVFMRKRANFKGEVVLQNARIDGQLALDGAILEKKLNAGNVQVGQNLFMHGATFKGEVLLANAKIDGQLLMGNGAIFSGEVILRNAGIGSQLGMAGATFEQKVNAEFLRVAQHLIMRNATFNDSATFTFARIGGSLDLSATMLTSLDLSEARVVRVLRLAGARGTATWRAPIQNDPVFTLRNTQIGALQDSPDAWPPSIDLEGFAYTHLGGAGATGSDDPRYRRNDEWIAWLAKDKGHREGYSPRPYAQLASVLASAGRRDQAHAIQFAGRERERRTAGQRCRFLQWLWLIILVYVFGEREQKTALEECRWAQWLWLTILAYVCGYGIGSYTFRVLWWIGGSVLLGTTVLWFATPAAHAKGLFWCMGASLDRLLPIIQVNKEFADFFNDPERTRVAGWVIAVFAGLGLWGWVLGSFLIAALSGLTQKT